MYKASLLGASALLLALGVATASAEPFNPTSSDSGLASQVTEGRAAAIDGPAPYQGHSGYIQSSGPSSVILQQFHEGK